MNRLFRLTGGQVVQVDRWFRLTGGQVVQMNRSQCCIVHNSSHYINANYRNSVIE